MKTKFSNGQISYRDLSNSVVESKMQTKEIINKVNSNLSRKETSRMASVSTSTMRKKLFKNPAPTYGNWDKFMINNLKQENSTSCVV